MWSTSLCLSQAFPPVPEERKPNSRLQERLLKKLGQHAHPFYFTVSHCSFPTWLPGARRIFVDPCRAIKDTRHVWTTEVWKILPLSIVDCPTMKMWSNAAMSRLCFELWADMRLMLCWREAVISSQWFLKNTKNRTVKVDTLENTLDFGYTGIEKVQR